MTTKRLLITLDRLKYPNCGLGRYSHDFGQTLLQSSNPDLKFDFLLPKKGYLPLERENNFLKLSNLKKIFSGYMDQYDLVHITHQLPNFKFNTQAKKIITIHDINQLITENDDKALKYVKKIQRNVDNVDAIVFISQFTKQFCEEHLNLPDNLTFKVIHNGINVPDTTAVAPKWLPKDRKFIFTIGQIMPKKNFHTLIPFLKGIPNDYDLIIAGEHSNQHYVDKIHSLIKDSKLKHRIHLPGSVTEAEKRFLYEKCDAFVFPSLAEGFGMPVIEAMRFKKPVFSSDKCSLKEIGGDYVFFWENFEAEYMASVFNQGMKKTNHNYLESAYDYSLKFSWKTNVNAHKALYNALLEIN